MRKIAILLFIALSISLFLPSCTNADERDGEFYTFYDSLGNKVALDSLPERVAVLFSSYADVWVTAGGRVDITVYEAVERGFAPSDAVLVDGGAGHTSIDTEALIAQEPDLVIVTADYAVQREAAALTRSVGIPTAEFRIESFEDYLGVLKIFTDILGTKDAYRTHGTQICAEIDAVISDARNMISSESMLFIRAGTSARSVKAKRANDHFACAMVEELGFSNIADTAGELLDGISLEVVIERDPDYIFITFMGDEASARAYVAKMLSGEGWSSLSAVKEGRVIYLPKDYFNYKPNARWAQAYEYLYSEIVRCVDL